MPDMTFRPLNLGGPCAVDRVVAVVDGKDVKAGDRVLQAIRAGNFMDVAADSAGVGRGTVQRWLRDGNKLLLELGQGRMSWFELDHNQKQYAWFADEFAKAAAQAEAIQVALTDQLARGGIPQTTTTTRRRLIDGVMTIVESEEKTSTTLPDGAMLRWRLATRWRDRWTERVEVVGKDGGPIELTVSEKRKQLLSSLATTAERLAPVDATVVPELPAVQD